MEGTLTNVIFKEVKEYSSRSGSTYRHHLFFKFKEFSMPCLFPYFNENDPRNNFMDSEVFPKKYAIKDEILGEEHFGKKFKFHILTRIYDDLMDGSIKQIGFRCFTFTNENEEFYSFKDLMELSNKMSTKLLWGSFLSICYSLFWFFLSHYFLLKEPKKNL